MHTIDLETLNEERLLNSVDKETHQLGLRLYENGKARVVELFDLSATCTIHDTRNYRVEFKIENQHLFLKCNCSHASRGLICEHDVAAWLAIRKKLIERIPPEWQQHLARIVDSVNGDRIHSKPSSYWLFFSLQKDPSTGSQTWKVHPFILPMSSIPVDITIPDLENHNWDIFFKDHHELALRIRIPSQFLEPEGCLNCSREAVRLANLMLERKHSQNVSFHFPLHEFLPLIRNTGGVVGIGNTDNPMQLQIEIIAGPADARLKIDRDHNGLHIQPVLSFQDISTEVNPLDIEVIHENPYWILHQNRLIELNERSSLDFLLTFRANKEIFIPSNEEAIFADQYLLDLTRMITIQGNAIQWEEVDLPATPRLYLNEVNGELLIQLKFAYGNTEVPYELDLPSHTIRQRSGSLTLEKLLRKPYQEQAAYDLLISSAFGLKRAPQPAKSGFFRLRARIHPVDFLLNRLPRLAQEGFEIFGEEKLKTSRVNRYTPSISFRVSSGIDWFDLQAVVSFGELEVPLKEVRRLIRKKERYVKLSDGSIGEIPEEWLDRYRHLFAVGDLQDQGLRFSHRHITLIDQALAAADRIEQDQEFARRRMQLSRLQSGNFKGITVRRLPKGFTGELRPYQKAGFDWLNFLQEYGLGGCLADDMGLGKTIQTLAFLQFLHESEFDDSKPLPASLLVVPRSLLVNWQREAAKFTPELKILEYFESKRSKDIQEFDRVDLVVTTYGVMLRDIQHLHSYEFFYAILDESQSIKNPLSQTARAAHLLRARNRLVLTGTPIENSTAELWSQFTFLNPGLLGNLKYFRNEFGLPIEKKHDQQAAEKLRRIVYPFLLRRTKDQVAPELPPRSERILYCDMEPAQRKLYNRTRDLYRGMLLGMMENQGLYESRMKILEGLLRLRQISNHPLLVDEQFHGASGKYELLLETLETLKAEGHKALVFSQFVKMLDILRAEMDQRDFLYTYLDGQTLARQEQVDVFQHDPSIPFFLISLKAGGLGLNLTAADYVIHIDPWWNPAVEMQASDRTHRIGQEKPVFIFKLITRDSVEEKVLLLQEQKKELVDQIITTESSFFKDLTTKDVQILFS